MAMPMEERIARRNGGVVLAAGANSKEQAQALEEAQRVEDVLRRRVYYEGSQYDAQNAATAAAMQCQTVDELPEHEKKHAYSTQIQEAIDFIAGQLADQFSISAKDAGVQEILEASLAASPDLSADEDGEGVSITNILRDALIACDVPVHVRWDPTEGDAGTPWYEFWEAEHVEFVYSTRDRHRLESVRLREMVWGTLGQEQVERVKVTTWTVEMGMCMKTVTYEDDTNDEEKETESIGLPFIPWVLLKGKKKKIRGVRGESLITEQAMKAADRYNSVEQTSYLIARYNSHGNLAVIGDGALVQSSNDGQIRKDVADVLTFPGGTALHQITLPTDPTMIVHQRDVLLDAMYGAFGITRIDQGTVQGMGQVSGYALEILNRKSDGTFSQIRKEFVRSLKAMLDMALDVHAYRAADVDDEVTREVALSPGVDEPVDAPEDEWDRLMAERERLDSIDPDDVFSEREVEITMGTGYIVDDVLVRDDFTAGLISREEALRKRGYSDDEIKAILEEIKKAEPKEPEGGLSAAALATLAAQQQAAGQPVVPGAAPRTPAAAAAGLAAVPAPGTQAGRTINAAQG